MGGEEAVGRAGAGLRYLHLSIEECRHLEVWGPPALPGQRSPTFDALCTCRCQQTLLPEQTDHSPGLGGTVKICEFAPCQQLSNFVSEVQWACVGS